MSEVRLTEQQLRAMFMAYPNARVNHVPENTKHNLDVVGIPDKIGNIIVRDSGIKLDWWVKLCECKLELHPFDNLTNEQCQAIAAVANSWYAENNLPAIEPDDVEGWLDDIMSGNSALMSDYVSGYEFVQIIDELRRLNIDCGYGPIKSLIEAGYAVRKEVGDVH